MLAHQGTNTPAKSGIRAAAAYLKSAQARANLALRRKLAQAHARRRDKPHQISILDDVPVAVVVGGGPLLDVIRLEVFPGYVLRLEFSTGERRLFSMLSHMAEAPFKRLSAEQFAKARIDYGSVVWPEGIDIAPEVLYELSCPA